jgi:hypothetical protein
MGILERNFMVTVVNGMHEVSAAYSGLNYIMDLVAEGLR